MSRTNWNRWKFTGAASLAAFAVLCPASYGQPVKVQGLIEGRSGPQIILKTADAGRVIVLLTDSTEVGQVQGVLKARKKEMSMAALIPGLAINAEGAYNEQHQLVAKSVKFKGDDLKRASAIQAGLKETKTQAQANREELEKHNAELQAQNEALRQHQEQITANQEKIAANKAAVEAAVARFGQLDDYYIMDETTVLFANGKTVLDPKYKPALTQFAEKAKTVEAYMIQVVGYASSTGSEELNQRLSEDRAHSVTNYLIQQCHIPLTNVMAPGAMGESEQVGNDKTAEGQAENRRVVVRVLQNKGVAGITADAARQ